MMVPPTPPPPTPSNECFSSCGSFGESVRVVHDFSQQFSSQSGVRLLQQFTFQQRKTKIAQVRACASL